MRQIPMLRAFLTAILLAFVITLTVIDADDRFITINRYVPHTSTVQANIGQRVGIFLHEKVSTDTLASIDQGQRPEGRVVLFVHGGSVPSVPDYDLPYRDYSWMEHLAASGYDTFAMDQTGYGLSPRPMMDDPCNLDRDNRALVSPNPLSHDCQPRYTRGLTTSQSDWDEIDRVVDYLRAFRGVDKISLIGWSAGGPRTGGYAARHPDKVDKLILFAPGYRADSPSEPTHQEPTGHVPMRLQTKETLMNGRWQSTIQCDNQVAPDVQNVIWQTIMAHDPIGSVWGPTHGVMRVRTSGGSWGWNREVAAKVQAPTLILVGKQDGLLPAAQALHADLTSSDSKVLVEMDCATHFAVWEATQYKFMHQASLEWLNSTTYRGSSSGAFTVGRSDTSASNEP